MDSNKLWFLKRINLFRCLDEGELERVGRIAQHRQLRRRELVFGPEDPGDAIYLLKAGRVKLSRFDESGKEITLAILEEGEFFGEEALQGDGPRQSCAEALDDAFLCRIERAQFEELMADNPELSLEVARQLSERLLGTQDRLEDLAFHDVPRRLAHALLGLAERHGEAREDGSVRLKLRLTHQELASLVASTRETTTSLLSRFRRDGLVETEGRWLRILDPDGLRRLAEGE